MATPIANIIRDTYCIPEMDLLSKIRLHLAIEEFALVGNLVDRNRKVIY
jgi:hypothetical protein